MDHVVFFSKVSKVVNCWILTLLRWRHTTSLWAHQVKLKSCGFLQSIPNPNGRLLEALQRQILWSKTLYYEKTARPNTIHCCSHNWIKVPIFPDQHLSLACLWKVSWLIQSKFNGSNSRGNSCTKLTLNFLCELAVNYQKIHMMNRLIATLKPPPSIE